MTRARAALAASASLCLALALCYAWQPDAFAVLTFIPAYCWAAAGLLLAALGAVGAPRGAVLAVCALWLAFALLVPEEAAALFRGLLPRAAPRREAFVRVVSLNCYVGTDTAARELRELDPDVVLLQEAPGRAAVEALARELFGAGGGVGWAPGSAILARGGLEGVLTASPRFTHALVNLGVGGPWRFFNVHLLPPEACFSPLNPRCWRVHLRHRREKRAELAALDAELARLPQDVPVVAGGDFNVPGRDRALRSLGPRLRDAAAAAGHGWPGTVRSDIPLLRFDQIWLSRGLVPLSVLVRRTERSDHRLVVADIALP